MNLIDWIGFLGVGQILLAYILNIAGKIKSNNLLFISLNLVGAFLACLASILMNYIPFIILEGVWTLASAIALIRYIHKKYN